MEKISFEALASKYGLSVDFVQELHEKVIDKENFARAVRMFAVGLLPYGMATGKDPINVAEYRHKVATNFWALHQKKMAALEQYRKINAYYNSCKTLVLGNKGVEEVVFIKDGHLVAFAHYDPRQGGIYAANNEMTPDFNWRPHEALARLRKLNKAFYRKVKKAAVNSPREWFDFNLKTKSI